MQLMSVPASGETVEAEERADENRKEEAVAIEDWRTVKLQEEFPVYFRSKRLLCSNVKMPPWRGWRRGHVELRDVLDKTALAHTSHKPQYWLGAKMYSLHQVRGKVCASVDARVTQRVAQVLCRQSPARS